MKNLSLVLSLEGLELADSDKSKGGRKLCCEVVRNIMLAAHKNGMSEENRRKFFKICDTLDEAVSNEADSVELEDDWFGFIKSCKRDAIFMPNHLIRRIEELIDAVKER